VLNYWAPIFFDGDDIENNGRQFDVLFKDEEQFKIGELDVKVIGTPGHTPACVCYVIKNNVFIGDTLFMPHLGTARVDFPDGSAEQLFNSIQKLFSYPDDTNLYVGHDYPKENIQPSCKTTVKDQKENNVILNAKTTIDEYIASRHNLDKSLRVPNLLLPALQVNLRAGRLPKPNANNIQHLMLPLNFLDP
jgi:glyoxylase-like metal-dependent hydrolase (beta-lactamase superfamily II)